MIEILIAVVLVGLLIAGGLYWLGRSTPSVPREVLLARTFSKILDGERDQVLKEMNQLYKRTQHDVGVGLAYGTLFRHAGKLQMAVQTHKSLLSRQNLEGEVLAAIHSELSADYLAAGLLERARSSASTALEQAPGDALAARYAERIYTRLKLWDEAVSTLQRFGKTSGEDVRERMAVLRYTQGMDLWEDDKHDEAAAAFKKALQLDEHCLPALIGQIRYFRKIGKTNKAISLLKKKEAAFEGHGWIKLREYKKIAVANQDSNIFNEAAKAYLEANPDDWRARAELGVFLTETGEYEQAGTELLACLEQSPHTVILHHYLWDLIRRQRDPRAVFQQYRDTLDKHLVVHDAYICNACGYRAAQLLWNCPVCFHAYSFSERTL